MPLRLAWSPRCIAGVLAATFIVACDTVRPVDVGTGYQLRVTSGDGQRGPAGAELAAPFVVRVEDADGAAVRGVRVKFSVGDPSARAGRLLDSISVTGGDGTAAVRAALGASGDTLRVDASIAFIRGQSVRFEAVAEAGPVLASVSPMAVRAGDTVTFAGSGFAGPTSYARFGGVTVAALGGATDALMRVVAPACLPAGSTTVGVVVGGAASDTLSVTYATHRLALALHPYDYVTIPAEQLADCAELSGAGATYLLAGEFAGLPPGQPASVAWQLSVSSAAQANSAVAATAFAPALRAAAARGATQRAFEARLRALETLMAPIVRSEQLDRSPRASARDAAVPAFGSLRTFSVVSAPDGSAFTAVTARLRYIGDHVLLYTDTYADTTDGGYNVSDLQALASLMDAHLWSAAVNAFGTEPDVDGDSHVIVLLTPVVNALTKAADCPFSGYVTGFFYPLDELERAAHSNHGEVFYGIVPDDAGRYSCVHTVSAAVRIMQDTFIHEMQHLISFNQHVLSRGGPAEDTWLNEGLSHVAEELGSRYFESRYPAPLGRSTSEQMFPDSAGPFIGPLLLNAYLYLNSSLRHSVTAYDGSGSIEERGATWLFLRWLVDQKGDGVLRRLVQTRLTGMANVEAASGERFGTLFGDFSLTLFADSLPGFPRQSVPSRLRFAGYSLRRLMAREAVVAGFPVPFPLTTYLASPGDALHGSMPAGTMIHAIIPGDPSGASLRLSFASPAPTPFSPALGAQLGILRLPP